MSILWQCPKCKRQFAHKNQGHSCVIYPVKKHLAHGSNLSKNLYFELLKKLKKIGPIKIESLPCCIHFVSAYTFGCCYIMKEKIRLHFVLKEKIKDKRVNKWSQVSSQKYLYEIDIANKEELDARLMKWLKEAYYLKVM
ncbi:MAG: DUF5655 domain-containing protein [Patescibacteria group bacterium]